MNDYIKKAKVWYEKISAGSMSYETNDIKPSVEWKWMLSVVVVLLVFLAGFAFYFYMKVDGGEMFTVAKDTIGKDAEIDVTLLKKIVQEIEDKKVLLNKIRAGNLVPNDPSL